MGERMKDVEFSRSKAAEPYKILDIQHAYCTKGCDLMTDNVKIHDMKAIAVKIKYQDKEGLIYLDPEFGSYDHESEIEVPDGAIVQFYCPHCGVSLQAKDETCRTCSAPVFHLELPGEAGITGCLRKGCFEHKLKIRSFDSVHLEVDDDFIRVIM